MRILISILLFSVSLALGAQSKSIVKADKLFYGFDYHKAIASYKKIAKQGEHEYYCYTKIAEAYSKLNQPEEAITWYKKCLEQPEFESKINLQLAHELLKQDNKNEASVYLHKYYQSEKIPHQLASLSFIDYYNELVRDSSRYQVIPLTINSESDEFGPTLLNNQMIFTSNRPINGIAKRKDIQTGQSFFNLYEVNKESTEATLLSKNLQTKYNDGPVCFSYDAKTAYITRNTTFDTKEVNALDIFVSKFDGKKWSKEVKKLPLRKGDYTVAHACISKDGKLFFFSSNMPGGYGGMDIYVCNINNGYLSQPKNLGAKINTSGNEIFPFISNEGVLYFSSDMHPGLGGYDLFFSKLINNEYSIPFNLGFPVNTSDDDFSLTLDETNAFGFFASNRKGGKGGDDLYALQINNPVDYCIIDGFVSNDTDSTALSNAFISVIDDETEVKMDIKTNKEGVFKCYLKKDKKYFFEVRCKLHTDFKGVLSPQDLAPYDVLKLNIGLSEK